MIVDEIEIAADVGDVMETEIHVDFTQFVVPLNKAACGEFCGEIKPDSAAVLSCDEMPVVEGDAVIIHFG